MKPDAAIINRSGRDAEHDHSGRDLLGSDEAGRARRRAAPPRIIGGPGSDFIWRAAHSRGGGATRLCPLSIRASSKIGSSSEIQPLICSAVFGVDSTHVPFVMNVMRDHFAGFELFELFAQG
jgi:hypothetical protein